MTADESLLLAIAYADPVNIDKAVAGGLTVDHFPDWAARCQWQLLLTNRAANKDTDPGSIYAAAVETGKLEACGGMAGITAASENPSAGFSNVDAVLSVLLSGYAQRESWKQVSKAKEMLEGDSVDLAEVGRMAETIVGICSGKQQKQPDLTALVDSSLALAQERWNGKQGGRTVSWGLAKADRFLTPIESHEYVLLCARPSQGKSSVLTSLCWHELQAGGRVAYFTLETSARSVVNQIAAQRGQLNLKAMADWMPEHQKTYKDQMAWIKTKAKDLLVFDMDMTLDAIQSRGRLLATGFKPTLVLLDYLGLVQTSGKDLYQKVSTVSKAMIPLRKSLGCPLVAGQQLNRGSQAERREPTLADLRDSGQLEEDAHRVVMLHWQNSHQLDMPVRDYSWLQPKLRDGPTTSITNVRFLAGTTTFTDSLN